ncbi:hypothetical protein ACIBG0_39985 [Nocardia sp. NPDC050630]|uniref:hypothetical protein n=1 Tax=Nocardia sp. NPDC050630 TaxID=3364321 RepID=UPI0037B917D0
MDHTSEMLGRVVEQALIDADVSIRKASAETGIAFTTLQRKLRGQGKTSFDVLELLALARLLQRPLSSLIPQELLA